MTVVSFLAEKDIFDFRLSSSGDYLSDLLFEYAKIQVELALKKQEENLQFSIEVYKEQTNDVLEYLTKQ